MKSTVCTTIHSNTQHRNKSVNSKHSTFRPKWKRFHIDFDKWSNPNHRVMSIVSNFRMSYDPFCQSNDISISNFLRKLKRSSSFKTVVLSLTFFWFKEFLPILKKEHFNQLATLVVPSFWLKQHFPFDPSDKIPYWSNEQMFVCVHFIVRESINPINKLTNICSFSCCSNMRF